MPGKLERLLKEAGLSNYFSPKEWVAVKTHFGSEGAHRIIRPVFLRKVVEALKTLGAKPFVTDTVRIKGLDYLEVANQNGLNHLSVGAPVVIADGLYGKDNIMVRAGDILGDIAVASLIHDVPAMVVCSHLKGHINAGYGGAIKNVAMGGVSSAHRDCGWKCGRGSMHTIGEGRLTWDSEKCELCYQCAEICPLDAIVFDEKDELVWDGDTCWRCGRCERVCQSEAIALPGDDERFMRSLAEAAKAVLSTFEPQKVLYVNFLTEIQPECDCMPAADVPVIQDKGIMISDDIVSIEQASIDLLRNVSPLPDSAVDQEEGLPADILYSLSKKPYMIQVEEAEKIGLGSRAYELIEL
ncbi:MAG TPA: DUF362 domain-containing protein [Thermodesulfovibrionales bacterium]|nr:DUF362 domain-containing protein [Thermodesulfovibrionales bacterium]